MKALSIVGARHFVKGFSADTTFAGVGVREYLRTQLPKGGEIREGTPKFNQLRDCLLREADRCLLLAASNFIRSLEGLRSSSCYWTLTGLYYSAFFSAKSLLGMYGCWMRSPDKWVEVVSTNPGKQRLVYRKQPYVRGKGSHQATWLAYYSAMGPLRSFMSAPCILAIEPVNSSPTWMIDARNEVNYEPKAAVDLMDDFEKHFRAGDLPNCFPGKFNTAFKVAEAFITLAREMVDKLSFQTDVFSPSRSDTIKRTVTAVGPTELRRFAETRHAHVEF